MCCLMISCGEVQLLSFLCSKKNFTRKVNVLSIKYFFLINESLFYLMVGGVFNGD